MRRDYTSSDETATSLSALPKRSAEPGEPRGPAMLKEHAKLPFPLTLRGSEGWSSTAHNPPTARVNENYQVNAGPRQPPATAKEVCRLPAVHVPAQNLCWQ